jgi:hypothetical protein
VRGRLDAALDVDASQQPIEILLCMADLRIATNLALIVLTRFMRISTILVFKRFCLVFVSVELILGGGLSGSCREGTQSHNLFTRDEFEHHRLTIVGKIVSLRLS